MIVFRRQSAFWIGIAALSVGVLLHVLVYTNAVGRDYVPAGTPMDGPMKTGMALLAIGILLTAYGIGPQRGAFDFAAVARVRVLAIAEAPVRRGHVALLVLVLAAAAINVLKMVARVPDVWLPLGAIGGMAAGYLFLGRVGERIGRRATILLAGLMFIATAIGGATPSFTWNLLMSILLGTVIGVVAPVGFTLVTETVPARYRGRLALLLGGTFAAAYALTIVLAAMLEPEYGWPVLWFIGLPTGVLLILLNRWIPESPRFLLATGRVVEATAVLRHFGAAFVYEDRKPAGG